MKGLTFDIKVVWLPDRRAIADQMSVPLRLIGLTTLCIFIYGCEQTNSGPKTPQQETLLTVDLSLTDPAARDFLTTLQANLVNSPDEPETVGQLAMAYEMNGFADVGLIGYQLASSMASDDPRWPYYEALLLASFGDYQSAISRLEVSLQTESNYVPGWIWKGRWHLELNQLNEAQVAFTQAIDLDTSVAARVGLAQTMLRKNQYEEALALLLAISKEATHPQISRLLSATKRRLGIDEASAMVLDQSSIGEVGFRDERSAVKRKYEQSISASLKQYAAWISESATQPSAFELIENLNSQYPFDERITINRLTALAIQGKFEEARGVLEDSIVRWPKNQHFHMYLAEMEFAENNPARALELVAQVLEVTPENSSALLLRGRLHAHHGELAAAIENFKAALTIQESASVHYALADIYEQQKDLGMSMCHLFQANELENEQGLAAPVVDEFLAKTEFNAVEIQQIKEICLLKDS